MTDTPDERSDPQLQLLRELARASAPIAGDVAKISDDTWAIHGVIPVDGDSILAEFDSYDDARIVLEQLPSGSPDNSDL
jgi:hypothetical protein